LNPHKRKKPRNWKRGMMLKAKSDWAVCPRGRSSRKTIAPCSLWGFWQSQDRAKKTLKGDETSERDCGISGEVFTWTKQKKEGSGGGGKKTWGKN